MTAENVWQAIYDFGYETADRTDGPLMHTIRSHNQARSELLRWERIARKGPVEVVVSDDERKAFEKWMRDSGNELEGMERKQDSYVIYSTNLAWKAWQARAKATNAT